MKTPRSSGVYDLRAVTAKNSELHHLKSLKIATINCHFITIRLASLGYLTGTGTTRWKPKKIKLFCPNNKYLILTVFCVNILLQRWSATALWEIQMISAELRFGGFPVRRPDLSIVACFSFTFEAHPSWRQIIMANRCTGAQLCRNKSRFRLPQCGVAMSTTVINCPLINPVGKREKQQQMGKKSS